jgi:hypothetical protein
MLCYTSCHLKIHCCMQLNRSLLPEDIAAASFNRLLVQQAVLF